MRKVVANKKGIDLAIKFLREGKSVVYSTDTSYGLAVDATNVDALKRLYKIKQRKFSTPVHIIVPSISFAKKILQWDGIAGQMAKKFWPGPLTIVCDLSPNLSPRLGRGVKILSGGTGTIGVRMPKNKIALTLVKKLGRPVTTPSANPPDHLGGYDSYSSDDVVAQFKNKKYRPDLILDDGKLKRIQPSTIVKVKHGKIKILRKGPITRKQIISGIASVRRTRGNPVGI